MYIRLVLFLLLIFGTKLQSECDRLSHVSLGIGVFNIVKPNRTAQYQIEYKWKYSFLGIQPFVSFFFTNQQSFYMCSGICYDIYMGRKLVLTPSFAPGLYFRGKGKDLGFPLEFRSSMALSYQFENKNRIGVQFYHISNASLGRRNPGEESLIFYYSFQPSF